MERQSPENILASLGLTPSEITVYRAGFSRALTAGELATNTGIKRPTVYHALGTLIQKGLCAKSGTGLRLKFAMAKPDALERLVDEEMRKLTAKKLALGKLLPLLASTSEGTEGVAVEQYEGEEGVKTVVEAALYCRSRKWDIIAPAKNFFSETDPEYARYFMEARASRGIVARSLWEKDPSRRLMSEEELRLRNPRFIPKALHGKFTSVIILFDDAVAVIAPKKRMTAVLIRSKDMHGTLEAMFEGLWLASDPYKGSVNKRS